MATFWERAVRSVDPMFSCIMYTCNFSYFPFEDRIWILIAPVPDHCLLVAFIHFKNPYISPLDQLHKITFLSFKVLKNQPKMHSILNKI